ncbi:MAG: FecR domain-containing protein [Muribaculaceae bacterium]|nr:FecR domain-containing protein [Muribaculaceae bacterium]
MNTDARIRKFLDDIYSDNDLSEVIKDLEDTSLLDMAADEADCSAESDEQDAGAYERDAREILDRITAAPKSKSAPLLSRKTRYWAAAAITLAVIAIASWRYAGTNGIVQESEAIYAEIVTSYGETKEIILADGTSVTLNSCSRLQYPETFSGSTRQVTLSGEAFFAVTRDENAPFIVNCQNMDITVLGTEFDVRTYDSDMTSGVSVKSGKVRVALDDDAVMTLHADQQLTYNNRTHDFDRITESRRVAAWRNGELTFDRTHIADVASELERTFNCRISFRDGIVPDNRITGSHTRSDLDDILQSIEYISGIHYTRTKSGDIILYR